MPPAANAFKAYRQAEVETLSQRDLLIKLCEGAIRFLREGQAAMRNQEIEQGHIRCIKAKRIFVELLSTLNFDQGGAVANQLRELYLFVISEISVANVRKDAEALEQVIRVIEPLLEGWRSIPDEYANLSALPSCHQSVVNLRT